MAKAFKRWSIQARTDGRMIEENIFSFKGRVDPQVISEAIENGYRLKMNLDDAITQDVNIVIIDHKNKVIFDLFESDKNIEDYQNWLETY